MAKKIAVVNMKGGVGKSTLCANIAWHFGRLHNWRKRVLAIDVDPQFNLSQYMLGARNYQQNIFQKNAPTIWDIFEQATRAPGLKAKKKDLNTTIQRVWSAGTATIDLVPSQLELNNTLKNPSQKEHLLSQFVDEIEANYDLILVDCPPTDSVLTIAAYLTCDYVLVPVKPEYLSTIGLPLMRQSLNDFAKLYRKEIEIAGVCFNMTTAYEPEERRSKDEVKKFCASAKWDVFKEEVPYSRSFPKGAREGSPIFGTSYSRTTVCREVREFCDAFGTKLGV